MAYQNLREWEQSLAYYRKSLKIREELGYRPGVAAVLGRMGAVYEHIDKIDQALDCYLEAARIFEEIDDASEERDVRYDSAMIYHERGELRKCIAEMKRVVELDRLLKSPDLDADLALLREIEDHITGGQE